MKFKLLYVDLELEMKEQHRNVPRYNLTGDKESKLTTLKTNY